jgi:hypothetical protein
VASCSHLHTSPNGFFSSLDGAGSSFSSSIPQ